MCNILGHSHSLKCTSPVPAYLMTTALTSPKELHMARIFPCRLLMFETRTTVVLGASILKIKSCFPEIYMECFAIALSLESSVCKEALKT